MIFLIDNKKIYFTMLEDGRTNSPILTPHLFLEKDLKKLIKRYNLKESSF